MNEAQALTMKTWKHPLTEEEFEEYKKWSLAKYHLGRVLWNQLEMASASLAETCDLAEAMMENGDQPEINRIALRDYYWEAIIG